MQIILSRGKKTGCTAYKKVQGSRKERKMDKITHDDVNEIIYTSFNTAVEMMPKGIFDELMNPLLDRLRADLGESLPKSSPLTSVNR